MTIHLPGQKFLTIDTKAPMIIHLRACGIENSEEIVESRHRAELASRDYTRAHSSSYELVTLFVPSEAALNVMLRSGAVLNLTKDTTNTGHNGLLSQDSLQPPLEPRQFPSLK